MSTDAKRRRSSLWLCAPAAALFSGIAASAVGPACYRAVPNDGLVDASFACAVPDAGAVPGAVGAGIPCDASPGTLPVGNCHVPWASGGESCPPIAQPCLVASGSACGDTACMSMTTNAPPIYDFRMEALHIIMPATLANPLLQNGALTAGLTPNVPSCGNEQDNTGDAAPHAGGFNWLVRLDSSKRTITTGGALPVPDPYQTGYCFLDATYGGVSVAPVSLDAVLADAGAAGALTFSSSPSSAVLNIPIFLTAANPTDPILLPIRGAEFHDVTISADGDCIGDINQAWYCNGTPTCSDNSLNTCPKWYTDGAFVGYMKLADADDVILQTGESLCAILVQETAAPPDGGPVRCMPADLTKGDYCSTGEGGACTDSVWLAATFAANAVKISPSGSSVCGD